MTGCAARSRDSIGELRESKEKLEEYSRTLEQRVEERTKKLTDALNELRALGEVGRAVSSTLDLPTVLTSVVSHAVELSGADAGAIYEYDDTTEEFHLRASHRMEEQLAKALRLNPVRFGSGTVGRAAVTGAQIQVADISRRTRKQRDSNANYSSRTRLPIGSGHSSAS